MGIVGLIGLGLLLVIVLSVQGGRVLEESPLPSPSTESAVDLPEQEETVEEQITRALADKHGWDAGQLEVTVSKRMGEYAQGGVRMKGEMGGGGWFAVMVGEEWQIVWDGNGTVMCEQLREYMDYPTELIPECYDEASGQVVVR